MVLYHSNAEPLDAPPDNLTVPQFFLDGLGTHPTRPDRTADLPCLIDEETGRVVFLHEVFELILRHLSGLIICIQAPFSH